MKSWRSLLAVAVATLAILLLTSIVFAAPSSTTAVQTRQVFESPILTNTLPMTHPVGMAIALYFNIPYTQVMSLHQQGWGFGNIARAYLTAAASQGALTPDQVLAMRQAGEGWGQIKKEFGIHPGGNGLGSIMGKRPEAPQPEPATLDRPEVKSNPPGTRPDQNASRCPGNSCSAPGQQTLPKGKPSKTPNK